MHLTVESARGRVPVEILTIHGDLDASNFQDVITKARELYQGGARHLLLDLSVVLYSHRLMISGVE